MVYSVLFIGADGRIVILYWFIKVPFSIKRIQQ